MVRKVGMDGVLMHGNFGWAADLELVLFCVITSV